MLQANILGLGDVPPLPRFNAWKAAQLEQEVQAHVAAGRAVPTECAKAWSAVRAGADLLHGEGDAPLMASPLFQSLTAYAVNAMRPAVESGDGGAVLEAVAKCAAHGLVLPGWLAAAFVRRVESVHTGDVASWDDPTAFGRAIPEGMNRNGVYARQQVAPQAYRAALDLLRLDPERPIDKGFYEDVGRAIGRSATSADDMIRTYVAEGQGTWPPLGELKSFLPAAGGDIGLAWLMWSDGQRREAWVAAGGTEADWAATFGRQAARGQPISSDDLPGLQA